jgi:hypothetical protein
MKSCFALFLFFCIATCVRAQNVSGYIVTLTNDTIPVQVKIKRGFMGAGGSNLNKKVEIIDSSNEVKVLMPTDIKAYGFSNKSGEHIYVSKPVENNLYYFLEPVIKGRYTSLYQYTSTGSIATSNPVSGGMTSIKSVQEFYTFEKSDGTYLFMTSYESLDNFRRKLGEFYKNKFEVLKLIDRQFESRRKIPDDVQLVVKLANL